MGWTRSRMLPDGSPLDADTWRPSTAPILIGDIPIPIIDVPAVPGFGNATTAHRQGFFNTGGGGGSGFVNVGAGTSG